MRTEKIALAISRDKNGRYTVQVLGIDGDRVVSSVSDLEEQGLVQLASVSRVVDRLWMTIKLRLNRGQLELRTGETNDDQRIGTDRDD